MQNAFYLENIGLSHCREQLESLTEVGLLAKGEYMWLGKTPGIYQIADQRVFILYFDL